MKLPVKISLSVSIVAIAFMLFLFNNIHQQLIQSEKEFIINKSKNDLEQLKENIDMLLSKTKNILSVVSATNLEAKNMLHKQKMRFEFYMKNIPEIRELKYISIDGKELISISRETILNRLETDSYLNKDSFKIALKEEFFISGIYFTTKDNKMMIDISKRILDMSTQKTVGVMIVKVSMDSIQEMISDKLIDFDGVALLDQETNEFLYKSSHTNDINDKYFLSSESFIRIIKENGQHFLMVTSEYNNIKLKLKLFLLTKESNLFAHIESTLIKNLQLLALLIILSSVIIYLITSNMLKPLKKLTNDIKNLSTKIDNKFKGNIEDKFDEVDEIRYSFDIFVKLIKDDKKQLNDFNMNLQNKVDEEVEKNKINQELLMQQSKMAAMGEMLESIAHQWRQPLSVITTSSTGIQMQKEFEILTDKFLLESCDAITNSAEHLSQTIDDFRNFFKQDKRKKIFNIKETLEATITLLISKFKNRSIEIIKNIDDVEISGFRNELIQVFMNILNNARDELETKDYKRLIFVDIVKQNDTVIIMIKDNAGGIPKEVLPNIFDAHFTTKDEKDGTGIGLYMTKKIIEDSFNGIIEAKTIEYEYDGQNYSGALFTISIPIG
ncbi:MAG: sensor histidine kinase [Arcobacteraceae bacterium]|nr:sensor histidine kinase [Arcobacteraceae bacterium]